MVKLGDKAPDFTLNNQFGQKVSLSDFRGKRVVLYFYPKDNTSGCTTEAIGFRDAFTEITDADAVVIGISKDSVKSHAGFAAKYELPFILLADEGKEVLNAYGVIKEKKMYGKSVIGVARTTFIIDEGGFVTERYDNVKAAGHAAEVVCLLKR